MGPIERKTRGHLKCAMFPNPFTDTAWMRSNHPLLFEMASQLRKLGCECEATPDHPSLIWILGNRRNIDLIHLHWPEQYYWPLQHSKFARLLSIVARRLKLTGLLRFLYLPWLFAFVTLTRLLKLPVIWTLHDLYPHGQTPLEHDRAEHIARVLLTRSVSVLILSCGSIEPLVVEEFGPPKKVVVAPLGNYRNFYPDTVSVSEARRAMGVQTDDLVFLYIGTMRKHRNALGLIRAFRDIPGKKLRLFVVGESRESLRRQMEEAAWGDWRIRCLFQLAPNDQIEFLLKACDFVVMPGDFYLTSAVIMLSLSYGRPVIAPSYGCAVEVAGDAAILYDSGDERGLATALHEAIGADHQKYKQLAAKRAKSLSWELTASRIVEAYTMSLGYTHR